MSEKIDYNKTVEVHKLILQDKRLPTFSTLVLFGNLIILGGVFSYLIIKSQLQVVTVSSSDWMISIFVPLIYVFGLILAYKTLFTRNRLKEIEITLHRNEAKQKILKAASELNWSLFKSSDNYLRFYTKSSFLKDRQTITIIFFPDNRVYFNSLHYPDDDFRPARFEQNYSSLIETLEK